MPFKQAVIPLMDDMDHSAAVIGAVNTIVNTDGFLKAYNTDVIAVASLLRSHNVDSSLPFLLRGSGRHGRCGGWCLLRCRFCAGHDYRVTRRPAGRWLSVTSTRGRRRWQPARTDSGERDPDWYGGR